MESYILLQPAKKGWFSTRPERMFQVDMFELPDYRNYVFFNVDGKIYKKYVPGEEFLRSGKHGLSIIMEEFNAICLGEILPYDDLCKVRYHTKRCKAIIYPPEEVLDEEDYRDKIVEKAIKSIEELEKKQQYTTPCYKGEYNNVGPQDNTGN